MLMVGLEQEKGRWRWLLPTVLLPTSKVAYWHSCPVLVELPSFPVAYKRSLRLLAWSDHQYTGWLAITARTFIGGDFIDETFGFKTFQHEDSS